jgi:hypothetical protein
MEDLTWGERLGTYAFRLMNWKIASKVRKISDELKEKESQTVGQ